VLAAGRVASARDDRYTQAAELRPVFPYR